MQKKEDIKETTGYWMQRINGKNVPITHPDGMSLEGLRHGINEGVKEWAKGKGIEAADLAPMKKDFEKEFIHILPTIYRLSKRILNQTKGFANQRKPSWHTKDFINMEDAQVNEPEPVPIVQPNKDGKKTRFGFGNRLSISPFISINPTKLTPEDVYLWKEGTQLVEEMIEAAGSSRLLHAGEYQKIFEKQIIEGIEVLPKIGDELGIPRDEVIDLKHQTLVWGRKYQARYDPDLTERQRSYDNQRGKGHVREKSTFKQRKKLYRRNNDDGVTKPGPILMWTKGGGWETLSYEEALRLQELKCQKKIKPLH